MASLNDAYSQNSIINSQAQNELQKTQPLYKPLLPQFTMQYPFWHQNMRQLLMIRQQGNNGDYFRRYTIDINGLRDNVDKTIKPFNYVLCCHGNYMNTQNSSNVCKDCGFIFNI